MIIDYWLRWWWFLKIYKKEVSKQNKNNLAIKKTQTKRKNISSNKFILFFWRNKLMIGRGGRLNTDKKEKKLGLFMFSDTSTRPDTIRAMKRSPARSLNMLETVSFISLKSVSSYLRKIVTLLVCLSPWTAPECVTPAWPSQKIQYLEQN